VGQFYFPMGLATDGAGHLFLSDMMNSRVQVFDGKDHAVLSMGQTGDRYGDMGKPRQLAVGPDGVIFVADPEFGADYLLSQVVSHHDLPRVESWLEAAARRGIELPSAFGVFFYRNGRRESLERLSSFFPVPVEAVAREFEAGLTPEEHCARSIVALRRLGIRNTYICNLGANAAGGRYAKIVAAVAAQEERQA